MGSTTKRYDTTPADTARLRGPLADWLGAGQATGPTTQFPNKATGRMAEDLMRRQQATGAGSSGSGAPSPFERINARQVAPTDSIDKLGGTDSPFFKNMMAQYQPAFDQKRKIALGQAKEASGTLTGSGYANRMGGAVNRSLADENLAVTGIAQYGIGQEMTRQQNRYNQESDTARSDARNFMELLMSQAGLGVGPDTIETSGGFASILPMLFKAAGMYMGRDKNKGKTDGGDDIGPNGQPVDDFGGMS